MQRFNHITNTKNNSLIQYTDILNISKYLETGCGYEGKCIYNLYGVINHTGNISSGHYYTYIKISKKNKWYEFNDDKVLELGNNLYNPYVYSLFYIKNS